MKIHTAWFIQGGHQHRIVNIEWPVNDRPLRMVAARSATSVYRLYERVIDT